MTKYFRRLSVLVMLILPILMAGCTSAQLRRSTVRHTTTLSDIYTQQVLNNLAMFIDNPSAVPFFAFPNQGTTAIQDTGNVGNPGYSSVTFITSPFMLNASRQATENWVLVPISDAGKLALMRCAYQQALASCIGADFASTSICPDCKELRKNFYDPESSNSGSVNDLTCLNASGCWLCYGCKNDVPKCCESHFVGSYGNTYVWVPPEGRDMLGRLTLTILDYAANDAAQFGTRMKTVEMTVDENGRLLGADSKAGIKITATIPIDQPSAAVRMFENVAIRQYAESFNKAMANHIVELAVKYNMRAANQTRAQALQDVSTDSYWIYNRKARDEPANQEFKDAFIRQPEYSQLSEQDKKALEFILNNVENNKITPYNIPDDSVLKARIVREKKGAASQGIQALGQQINAALAK